MRIRLTQFLIVPVTTMFCMLAFSSTLPGAGKDQPFSSTGGTGMLLAATDQAGDPATDEKVHVCKTIDANGKMVDLYIPYDTYLKQHEENPNQYELRSCEEVMSRS